MTFPWASTGREKQIVLRKNLARQMIIFRGFSGITAPVVAGYSERG